MLCRVLGWLALLMSTSDAKDVEILVMMPRVMLRYATERLDPPDRSRYLTK